MLKKNGRQARDRVWIVANIEVIPAINLGFKESFPFLYSFAAIRNEE